MYSLSGMATISASVSSSTGLVFQLLASLGSRLATRERGAEMVVVIVFASQQRRPRLPGDGWVAGVRRCGLPLPEQAGALVSTPVPPAAFISHGLVGQGRTNANPRVTPQPRVPLRHQALIEALAQDGLGQVDANEHHAAFAAFVRCPLWPQVAAHELVYALENHLALGALHIENALVAQHARAVDVDDGTQKILQLGRVERACGTVNKALHIIVVVMVVRVLAMRPVLMGMPVIVIAVAVVVVTVAVVM